MEIWWVASLLFLLFTKFCVNENLFTKFCINALNGFVLLTTDDDELFLYYKRTADTFSQSLKCMSC